MKFLVIRIQPVLFLRDPFQHMFERSLDDFNQKKLSSFDNVLFAEQFIRKQQILSEQHILMLAFEKLLQHALTQRNRNDFFSPMREITYFAPHRAHHGRRIELTSDHRVSRPDEDFVRAQTRSMRDEPKRPQPRTSPNVNAITAKDTLPADFKLASEKASEIRENKCYDPIEMGNCELNTMKEVACFRLSNGFYQVYPTKLINDLKARSTDGTFKDPMTNEAVDSKNVFTVTPNLLTTFVGPEPTQLKATPAQPKAEPVQPDPDSNESSKFKPS